MVPKFWGVPYSHANFGLRSCFWETYSGIKVICTQFHIASFKGFIRRIGVQKFGVLFSPDPRLFWSWKLFWYTYRSCVPNFISPASIAEISGVQKIGMPNFVETHILDYLILHFFVESATFGIADQYFSVHFKVWRVPMKIKGSSLLSIFNMLRICGQKVVQFCG